MGKSVRWKFHTEESVCRDLVVLVVGNVAQLKVWKVRM